MLNLNAATTQTAKDENFSDRLKKQILKTGSYLCVGIDPPLSGLSEFFEKERTQLGPKKFLERFGMSLVEASAGMVAAIKPQSAYFEAYGAEGFAALSTVIKAARTKGLLTILDAKRGDISSTMAAYGRMAFDVMEADALTVTPYMGLDVLDPLWPWLKKGKGVYVVWVSSNPTGSLIQDSVAEPLLDALKKAASFNQAGGSLGLVLGATKVESLSEGLYDAISSLPLLMPGIGAQGGQITGRIKRLKAQSGTILVPQARSLISLASQASNWDSFCEIVSQTIQSEAADLHV